MNGDDDGSLAGTLFGIVRRYRSYVIVPFLLIAALMITLLLTDQSSAPFIYTLF